MATFILTGTLPAQALNGYLMNPEDRSGPLGKLVEAAGGTLKQLYYTTGESDFLMIIEAENPDTPAAAAMVAGAAGMAGDLKTVQVWSGAEFEGVVRKAAGITESYAMPGGI